MALNIKSDEAHRLARELAEARGTTLTEAVTDALRGHLAAAEARGGDIQLLTGRGRRRSAFRRGAPRSRPAHGRGDPRLRYPRASELTVILDTSALLAILFGEPEGEALVKALASDPERLLAAPASLKLQP
jgi:hypothetical protein